MMIAIEVNLKFHLLGNVELEFAFMIDFLKKNGFGILPGEQISLETPQQPNENTMARY